MATKDAKSPFSADFLAKIKAMLLVEKSHLEEELPKFTKKTRVSPVITTALFRNTATRKMKTRPKWPNMLLTCRWNKA